jgi:hypothetical protein
LIRKPRRLPGPDNLCTVNVAATIFLEMDFSLFDKSLNFIFLFWCLRALVAEILAKKFASKEQSNKQRKKRQYG